MASFVFPSPDDIQEFEAPNGILYTWDTEDGKWVVKSTSSVGSKLDKPYVVYHGPNPPTVSVSPDGQLKDGELWYSTNTLELFVYGSDAWWPTAADVTGELSTLKTSIQQAEQDIDNNESEIQELKVKVDDLQTIKGEVALYKVANNVGTLVSGKGEFATNTSFYSNVNSMSFGIEDEDGRLTKPMAYGDIIETVDPSDSKVNRYKITDASGAPTLVAVEYISGSDSYDINDEKQIYIYPQNEAGATQEYIDDQLDLKVNKAGDSYTGYLDFKGDPSGARFFRGNTKLFSIWDFSDTPEIRGRIEPDTRFKLTGYITGDTTERQLIKWDSQSLNIYRLADPSDDDNAVSLGYANKSYLKLTGGTVTGTLSGQLFKSTKSTGYAFEVKPDNKETMAAIRNDGKATFTRLHLDSDLTSPTERTFEVAGRRNDGTIDNNFFYMYNNATGTPSAINYDGKMDSDNNIVNKGYVDRAVGSRGGVPVGSIMMWMNSTAPDGWFKLQGGTFDINTYPLLHAYLQGTDSYVSGRLPDWKGHYPGEYGDHLSGVSLGRKLGQRTAMPDAGAPYHPNSIPNGNTRTFTSTGGTNAYSNGTARPAISEGWDDVTRPPTVVVHYIIKHD